jgi:Short C-terminal domain
MEKPRQHRKTVAALLIVATLLSFVAIFSVWINRQALNTDNWVTTSDKVLQNKDVQSQLSIFLADQLFAGVDVQAELQKSLPPRLQPLAGPASGALHQLAPQIAQRALATPQFQTLWSQANRAAHETLLKIVDGSGGGQVTLDLGSLVKQIGSQLGGSGAIASKIPPNAGQLTVLKSSQISTVQKIAKLIRRLPIVLTLLVLLLYASALYLAGPRRRQALRSVGFSFIVAGVLALVVRGFAGNAVTSALASSESVKPAVDAVWSIGTSLLVTVAVSAITFGILIIIGAWLAGPTRLASALRREAAPYLRERRVATYSTVALVFLALVLWAPVVAFHKLIGLILLAVLMVLGTEALRRQTAVEFPEADFGGFGERIGAAVPGRGGPPPQAPAKESKVDELERLSTLKEQGALSDEEFESAKAEVLGP